MASSKRYLLHVVCAFDRKLGMGYRGGMPWPFLKTDVDFMHRITTETREEGVKNAVVMGRKTWESIKDVEHTWAESFVIVLSSKPPAAVAAVAPGADLVCSSLNGALDTLQSPPLCDQIESVYILGGHQVYKEVMEHPQCGRLYVTEIDAEFPADTFYPPIDKTIFKPVECDDVPQGEIIENGVKYRFIVYEKQNRK